MIENQDFNFRRTVVNLRLSIKGYDHADAAKHKHHNEIGGSSTKRTLFKHSAISVCKYNVKKESKANGSEKQKRRDQSPYLVLMEY